jgi:hypothetical protein
MNLQEPNNAGLYFPNTKLLIDDRKRFRFWEASFFTRTEKNTFTELWNNPQFFRACHGLDTTTDIEFLIDVAQVGFDGGL